MNDEKYEGKSAKSYSPLEDEEQRYGRKKDVEAQIETLKDMQTKFDIMVEEVRNDNV